MTSSSSSKLQEIFTNLGRLASLRELNLSSNDLSIFPNDLPLGSFSALESLNLSYNSLSKSSALAGLFALSALSVNLRELDLSRNALCSPLPKEIAELKGLEKLYLDECNIGSVDVSINNGVGASTNLLDDSITHHQKQSEDDLLLLSTLPSLLRLSLSRNYLSSLPTSCSRGFQRLQHLNVSHNLLSIDCNLILLFSLPNLQEVEIFGNPCADKAAELQGEIYRSETAATWAHTTSLTRMYESYPGSKSAPRSMRSMSPTEKRTRDSPSPYAQQAPLSSSFFSSSSSSSSSIQHQRGHSPIPLLPPPSPSSPPIRLMTAVVDTDVNAGITPSGSVFLDETIDAIKDLAETSIESKQQRRRLRGSHSRSRTASPTTSPPPPPRTSSSFVGTIAVSPSSSPPPTSSSPSSGRPLSKQQYSLQDVRDEASGIEQVQPQKRRLLKIILEDRPRPPAEIMKDRVRSSSPPLISSSLRSSSPQNNKSHLPVEKVASHPSSATSAAAAAASSDEKFDKSDQSPLSHQRHINDSYQRPSTVPALSTRRKGGGGGGGGGLNEGVVAGTTRSRDAAAEGGVTLSSTTQFPAPYNMRKKMLKVTPIKVLEIVKKKPLPVSNQSSTRLGGTHPPFSTGYRKIESHRPLHPPLTASYAISSAVAASSSPSSSSRRYAILSQFELPGFISSSSSSSSSSFKTSTGEYLDPEAEALYTTLTGSSNIFAKAKKHKEKRDLVRKLTGRGYYSSSDREARPSTSNASLLSSTPDNFDYYQHRPQTTFSSSSSSSAFSYESSPSSLAPIPISQRSGVRTAAAGGGGVATTASSSSPLGNILEFGDRGEEEEEEEEEVENGDDADLVDDSVINPQGDDYFEPAVAGAIAAPVSNSDTFLPRSFLRANPQASGGGKSGENLSSSSSTAMMNSHDDDIFENGDDYFVDDTRTSAPAADHKHNGRVTSSRILSSLPNPPLVTVSESLRSAMAAAFADVTEDDINNTARSRGGGGHSNTTNNGSGFSPRSISGANYDASSSAAINAAARFRNPALVGVGGVLASPQSLLDAGVSVASSSVLLGGLQMGASTARSLFANSSTNSVIGGGGRGGGMNNSSSSNNRSLHLYKTALHGLRNSLKRNTNSFEGTTSFRMKGPTAIQRARQRPLIGYLAHGSADIEFEANDNDATSRGANAKGKNSWNNSERIRNGEGGGEQGLSHNNRGDNTDAFNVRTELPLLLQQSFSRGQIGVEYLDQVDFSGQRRRPVTNGSISSSLSLLQQQEEGGVVIDRAGTASSVHHGGPRALPAFRGVMKQAAEAQASYIALEALLHAVEEGGGNGIKHKLLGLLFQSRLTFLTPAFVSRSKRATLSVTSRNLSFGIFCRDFLPFSNSTRTTTDERADAAAASASTMPAGSFDWRLFGD